MFVQTSSKLSDMIKTISSVWGTLAQVNQAGSGVRLSDGEYTLEGRLSLYGQASWSIGSHNVVTYQKTGDSIFFVHGDVPPSNAIYACGDITEDTNIWWRPENPQGNDVILTYLNAMGVPITQPPHLLRSELGETFISRVYHLAAREYFVAATRKLNVEYNHRLAAKEIFTDTLNSLPLVGERVDDYESGQFFYTAATKLQQMNPNATLDQIKSALT